jgi:diacylglycerol O-acyltransferase
MRGESRVSTELTNQQAWAAASAWGREGRMSELETLMWRSERHPQQSSTILSLMLLDQAPEWNRLVAAHQWAAELIPRTRQRVLEPALPVGPPAWVPDEHFDLDYHLRRARLPGDGSMASLLSFAASFAIAPLDRQRPLWEAMLLDGLDGGQAAYLLKMHHSLTDGLGGIQLMSLVQSRTREHTENKPRPEPGSEQAVESDPVQLAVDELGEQVRGVPSLANRLLRAGRSLVADPGGATSEAVRYAASLRRVLPPAPAKPSPLLRGRSGRVWRFGVLECELDELKAAGKTAGGSVNDAFVAALLGGLRRYHDLHGKPIDELPMAMPVSLRRDDDPMGGNKFAGALFAAPVGLEDPAERIAAIRGAVLSLRTEPALDSFSVLAPVVNRLPSAVGAAAWRLGASADLSASNVPGVPYQTYLAGAKVQRVFPFGPLPGVAVMAAMVSHVGTCCLGFNIDGSVVRDRDALMRCFADGLTEVLALGRGDT